jgi:hypothetical protein
LKPIFFEYTNPADRHLIGGQSSGLIGADNGSAAESFDGRKTTHDGVLLGHTTSTKGQTGCDDSWKTFWNSSDSQSDGDFEVVDGSL